MSIELKPMPSIIGSSPVLKADAPVNNDTLNMVARIPTLDLPRLVEEGFMSKLSDRDFMRIAVLLAHKSYEEGGCPIGGLVIDNETRLILGKGHNRHVQETRMYWHGETDAYNDAFKTGLKTEGIAPDFRKATAFTTLTPCNVCTALTHTHSFNRLVIGNRLDGQNFMNETILRQKGVIVDILEDQEGQKLYAQYAREKTDQDIRDWQGQAGVNKSKEPPRGPVELPPETVNYEAMRSFEFYTAL